MYGYSGRMLTVDLTSGKTRTKEIPEAFCRKFLGGNGFGIKFLYDYTRPGIDPLSPDNVLVFAVGPFCGTPIPTSSKYVVQAKSPLTGFQGEATSSSFWASAFRRTGHDALLIRGRAKKPSYLFIDDDDVELRDAKEVWGKDALETESIIREEIGDDNVRVATIGPAGENLVRFALIANDGRFAGRTGMGAVMGSKQIKAVAVRGSKAVEVAKLDELMEFCPELIMRYGRGSTRAPMRDLGTLAGGITYMHTQVTPYRNFQRSASAIFEETELRSGDIRHLSVEWMREHYVSEAISCDNCPIACEHINFVREGPYKGTVNKVEYESFYALGPLCAIRYFPAITKACNLVDTLGLDSMSTGVVVAWAMECFERGIFTLEDTEGIKLTFGNDEALIKIIPKIAYREGLGNILAEGVKRASEKVGRGSEYFAMHVMGLEFPGFDVRQLKASALAYATSVRGACHMRCSVHSPELKGLIDRFKVRKDHGRFVAERQNFYSIYEALVLCKFKERKERLRGAKLIYDEEFKELAYLYALVTGIPITAEDIRTAGERIWNMKQAYNIREGWTRKDSSLPPRLLKEPIPDGLAKGSRLTEEELDFMLDQYYTTRGWTKKGIPTKQKLIELGLEDVADEIGA